MAEALLRHFGGQAFHTVSAGTEPQAIHPQTLETLQQEGIPAEGLYSKALDDLNEPHFDYIISLCSKARQECQTWPGSGVVLAWDFPDPKHSQEPDAFFRVFHAIKTRIHAFIDLNKPIVSQASESLSAIAFYKALSDEIRLKSLLLIQEKGELCVCEIMSALDESQPKVSRHLAMLRNSGLLLDRRHKQWVYYRLHPLMHSWMTDILVTTRLNNPELLSEPLGRLASISDGTNNQIPAREAS